MRFHSVGCNTGFASFHKLNAFPNQVQRSASSGMPKSRAEFLVLTYLLTYFFTASNFPFGTFDLFCLHSLQICGALIVRAAAAALAHEARALPCHLLRTSLHHSGEKRVRP